MRFFVVDVGLGMQHAVGLDKDDMLVLFSDDPQDKVGIEVAFLKEADAAAPAEVAQQVQPPPRPSPWRGRVHPHARGEHAEAEADGLALGLRLADFQYPLPRIVDCSARVPAGRLAVPALSVSPTSDR